MGHQFDSATPPSKLELQWHACKNKNKSLLPTLARMARELKRCGYTHYSINGLFEALRWETRHSTGDLGLKVNNNHRAFAARDLMSIYPDLDGFFRVREQKPRPDNWGQMH
tara:strand:+ start:454 stop:786 length:333 start_codon:yes stop_codon:yes gene_type:complete